MCAHVWRIWSLAGAALVPRLAAAERPMIRECSNIIARPQRSYHAIYGGGAARLYLYYLYIYIYIYVYISSHNRLAPAPQKSVIWGARIFEHSGGALIRSRYVICEHSPIGGRSAPLAAAPASDHILAHIDTQVQTCTQSYTDVLVSLWYFLVFSRGHKFSCSPLFLFPRSLFYMLFGMLVVPCV